MPRQRSTFTRKVFLTLAYLLAAVDLVLISLNVALWASRAGQ